MILRGRKSDLPRRETGTRRNGTSEEEVDRDRVVLLARPSKCRGEEVAEDALHGEFSSTQRDKHKKLLFPYIVPGLDITLPSQLARVDVQVPGRLCVNSARRISLFRGGRSCSLEHGYEVLWGVFGIEVLRPHTARSRGLRCVGRGGRARWSARDEDVALDRRGERAKEDIINVLSNQTEVKPG